MRRPHCEAVERSGVCDVTLRVGGHARHVWSICSRRSIANMFFVRRRRLGKRGTSECRQKAGRQQQHLCFVRSRGNHSPARAKRRHDGAPVPPRMRRFWRKIVAEALTSPSWQGSSGDHLREMDRAPQHLSDQVERSSSARMLRSRPCLNCAKCATRNAIGLLDSSDVRE